MPSRLEPDALHCLDCDALRFARKIAKERLASKVAASLPGAFDALVLRPGCGVIGPEASIAGPLAMLERRKQ